MRGADDVDTLEENACGRDVAAFTIGASAAVTSTPASARGWGGHGWGWGPGAAAGAAIGGLALGAIASQPYYDGYGYPGYTDGYGYPAYGYGSPGYAYNNGYPGYSYDRGPASPCSYDPWNCF
jgi:hypothetical protein